MDERGGRLFVAAEKAAAGYGGTAAVFRPTGVARSTILRGVKDRADGSSTTSRIRRRGTGRPLASQADPTMLEHFRRLVEPATMSDPVRPLLWVSLSREKLAVALRATNHAVSASTAAKIMLTCVADEEMAALNIATEPWPPEWNHIIRPRSPEQRGIC